MRVMVAKAELHPGVGRYSCQPIGRLTTLLSVILLCLTETTHAQNAPATLSEPTPTQAGDTPKNDSLKNKDILDLDIEQLANVPVKVPTVMETLVTSPSRTPEPIGRTPAAIYVVTNEMIRRCGARNVPEVLRTVPGVQVARINASTWAISIRGFNGRFSNKLLVQIDGVAIYSPLHSGVFWEREPVMLEDVERIEVIRGPGGTTWGNNAVNGIINITTKSSKDTKGLYAEGGGGNEHRQFGSLRAGGQAGENVTYRVWGAGMDDNCGGVQTGQVPADYYNYSQGGFRTDWTPTRNDTFTFEGDFVQGISGSQGYLIESLSQDSNSSTTQAYDPTAFRKTMFMSRWKHVIDDDTDWACQAYYYNPYGNKNHFMESNSNFDVDFQYHMKRNRHDIVWGCGYRNDNETIVFNNIPNRTGFDTEIIPSYFFQDTVTLRQDLVFLTFGSKFDNNNITNFEYQPTVRLAVTPDEKTTLWAAITRAVRTPSLTERVLNTDLQSEDVLSYELGFRQQTTEKCFWELAVFYNRYNNLIGTAFTSLANKNIGNGDTYGFEYNTTYQVTERWKLTGSYSFFIETLYFPAAYNSDLPAGANPRNQFYIQSGWDLGHDVSLDVMLRYVDSLTVGVENYFVSDVRLAWRPTKRLEIAAVGQNLFDGRHFEFDESYVAKATEVKPCVYGIISYRY
jgi:iron complex outermembrane recepter protein